MSNLINCDEAIVEIEKAMHEDEFREGTGLIHKTKVYEILRSLVSSENPDIFNLQENKFKDNLFDIHNVRQNSKDYPSSVMDIVPNKEKYHLISINGLIVMPLFEFINYIIKERG